MIKPFAAFALLLLIMVFSMGLHFTLFPYIKNRQTMTNITALTYMAPLSLSVSYDESIFNRTYPDMSALGRMDFIYER